MILKLLLFFACCIVIEIVIKNTTVHFAIVHLLNLQYSGTCIYKNIVKYYKYRNFIECILTRNYISD